MPISYEHKCIFIHIPKTGGGSVEALLRLQPTLQNYYALDKTIINFWDPINKYRGFSCPAHLPAPIIKSLNPLAYKDFYKFSIVRNPYDKILSEYCWKVREQYAPEESNSHIFLQNFKAWVNNLPEVFERPIYSHLIPQHYYLYENNNLLVDEVYRFEEGMKDILEKIAVKLNIKRFSAHQNKNKFSIDKNQFLTQKVKDIIYSLYAKDFEIFGYKK